MAQATGRDLAGVVHDILKTSTEPLPLPRIRKALPVSLQTIALDALAEILRRQAAAQLVFLYPRYRSPHDRYWDRPMRVHIGDLLRRALREGPQPWSELRRRLPAYARRQAESILEEEVVRRRLFRHAPVAGQRARYGLAPAEPRAYVLPDLESMFRRLAELGFQRRQVRAAALDLLHEEEWSEVPPVPAPRVVNYALPIRAFADVLDAQLVPIGDS